MLSCLISNAEDSLIFEQLLRVFEEKTSSPPTTTFGLLGSAIMWSDKQMRVMVRWFGSEAYGADIERCRQMNPKMMVMRTCLDQSSWSEK